VVCLDMDVHDLHVRRSFLLCKKDICKEIYVYKDFIFFIVRFSLMVRQIKAYMQWGIQMPECRNMMTKKLCHDPDKCTGWICS
jgi:hypothetical protein